MRRNLLVSPASAPIQDVTLALSSLLMRRDHCLHISKGCGAAADYRLEDREPSRSNAAITQRAPCYSAKYMHQICEKWEQLF